MPLGINVGGGRGGTGIDGRGSLDQAWDYGNDRNWRVDPTYRAAYRGAQSGKTGWFDNGMGKNTVGGAQSTGGVGPAQPTMTDPYGMPVDAQGNQIPGGVAGAPGAPGGDGKIHDLASLKAAMSNGGNLTISDLAASMPEYQSIMTNDANGNPVLGDPYKFDYGGSDAFSKMRNMAMSSGPTDMYKQNENLIDMNQNRAVSGLNTQADTGLGVGISSLAQTGGIDSGARERLSDSSQMARLTGAQDIYGQGASSKAQALINDTAMKNQMLNQVTGYDVQSKNLNTNAAIGDLFNKNNQDLGGWGKLGDVYGAGIVADAQAKAANKEDGGLLGMGGFLGTGIGGKRGMLGTGILGNGNFIDTSKW